MAKNNMTGGNLASTYPVNTLMELKLSPGTHSSTTIRGLIYCTDEISNVIVLKRSAGVHTTVSSEITVVNASCVLEKKTISSDDKDDATLRELAGVGNLDELKLPLPNVSRKALEEREKRAIRLAEESFSHINQKATPEGQLVFDKLLKACNEVVWKGESIIVLKEIRVDPPYKPDNCSLIKGGSGGLDAHSLERVKKIVSTVAVS